MFDNRLPTALIVDLIPVTRRVDDVQLELDAILNNDMRLLVDLCRLADGALIVGPSFGVYKVGCKEGVDEG
jgi:hypothetical protein